MPVILEAQLAQLFSGSGGRILPTPPDPPNPGIAATARWESRPSLPAPFPPCRSSTALPYRRNLSSPSLARVRALKPARLLPAHGPVIDDPDEILRGYLEHPREREEQILAALRGGEATSDALVPVIYRGLKDSLLQVARETVLAHLVKLERDGRARRRGDTWHIIEP